MKIIPLCTVLMAVLLMGESAESQVRAIQPSWLKVNGPSKWIEAPRELHLKQRTGSAELMVLYPDGEFGYLACYLIQTEKGRIGISRGDGLVVGRGQWTRSGDKYSINSRIVYRVVTITGQSIPEPWQTQEFSEQRNGAMKRLKDNSTFHLLPRFDDFGFLASVLSCDRRYFDGKNDVDGPQPCQPISATN